MQNQSIFQQVIFYKSKFDSKICWEDNARNLGKMILRNSTKLEDSQAWIQDLLLCYSSINYMRIRKQIKVKY